MEYDMKISLKKDSYMTLIKNWITYVTVIFRVTELVFCLCIILVMNDE